MRREGEVTDKKLVVLHDRIPTLQARRKKRSNRRLIFFLSFFFFLILIVIYFQSPLSHVQQIIVTGNVYVSDEEIIEASEIKHGTSIWEVNQKKLLEVEELREVKAASLKRIFPNKVEIQVEEYKRVAYLNDDGKYFPIIESGRFLEALEKEKLPTDAPILKKWQQGDELEEFMAELTKLPESISRFISEVHYAPTPNDALRIKLYMNDGHEVHTTIQQFSERMLDYPAIASTIDSEEKGIIHMRLTPYFERLDTADEEEADSESER